jgi:hypothetical protein
MHVPVIVPFYPHTDVLPKVPVFFELLLDAVARCDQKSPLNTKY